MTPRHRVTDEHLLRMPTGITPDDERRRYFHGVGITSRIRIHRELRDDGNQSCPLCGEELA